MRFIQEFFQGFSYYPKAIKFIQQHRLWGYLIIPSILNLSLLGGIATLAWRYSDKWITMGLSHFPLEEATWWGQVVTVLVTIVVKILVFLVYFKFYKYIVLTLLTPFLSLIAEKVLEKMQVIVPAPFEFQQFLKDTVRGIQIALKSFFVEMGILLGLFLMGVFIPFLSPVVPILIIVLEAYFFGFSMMDYYNELLKVPTEESLQLIRKHKGFAVGNGLCFNLILFIPLLGILFGPLIAVTAASMGFHHILQKEK